MYEKNQLIITFNNENYVAYYNDQTDYYEIQLKAPEIGGIYNLDISFTDLYGDLYEDILPVQIWEKEPIVIETNKVFMWIFDYKDFSLKDIVEIADYEINIDEETNANTLIKILKKTSSKAKDIVAVKKNNEVIYWGIIDNIQNEDGKKLYEFTLKYITNMFNQNIQLTEEELIRTSGIEDFIGNSITKNFISNEDTFINLKYLQVNIKTHNKKQTTVSNVQDGIFNLHTYMTNCTQLYEIVYNFYVKNKKLVLDIENKSIEKELIDVGAQPISGYTEVFETDIISKVIVLTKTETYTLYLLNDRTTSTDKNNKNRAEGKIETVYTENYEDAPQTALDKMKANAYNHNITFKYLNRFIPVGTPIAIKTKESIIFDTYISAIKMTQNKFIEYTCGNIRVKFIDKLLKERKK